MLSNLVYSIYFRLKKDLTINTREELYNNTDWEHVYNNPEILDYTYNNAQSVIQGQHNDLESIRNKSFSIFNYLFIAEGGLFYIYIAHFDTINHLKYSVAFVIGYIICVMIYILCKLVFPSQIGIQYGTPSTILQDKKTSQVYMKLKLHKFCAYKK